MSLSGISRIISTRRGRSLNVTSAAQAISLSVNPQRMAASVFMLHGAMFIPSWRNDPLAIDATRE
jgi:hypothetical protein